MSFKSKIRTAAEFTVSATVIATLLAACGGGGGGTAAAPAGANTTLNVTPALGKFSTGSTVIIKDKTGTICGQATTNASGVAPVGINSNTCAAPFIVQAGKAGDTYFDEAKPNTLQTITGNGINAVLPQLPLPGTGVGVTALTNIAAGRLLNAAGQLSASAVSPSYVVATNQAIADMFLPGGDILSAPNAAASGVPAADAYGAALAALAHAAAPGKNALNVAKDLADDLSDGIWDGLNANNASQVIATPATPAAFSTLMTTATASAVANIAPGITAPAMAPVSNVSAAITSLQTAVNTASAATSNFLNDIVNGGLRSFFGGFQYVNPATGATITHYATGSTITATLANGIYTVTHTLKEMVNKVWQAISPTSNNRGTNYVLTANGWVDSQLMPGSFTVNANGTATTTNTFGIPGTFQTAVCAADVSGTAIGGGAASAAWAACNMNQLGGASAVQIALQAVSGIDANGFAMNTNASGVQITPAVVPTGNFPVGSRKYLITPIGNSTTDIYHLYTSPAQPQWGVTDLNGVALTAVPTASFCANGYVMTPIAGAAPGADNYNVYGTMGGCTQASIAAGLQNPVMATVLLSNKATGNAAVPTVGMATVSQANLAGPNGMFLAQLNGSIIGVAGGKALTGTMFPAGTPLSVINGQLSQVGNKTAADAFMTAFGWGLL